MGEISFASICNAEARAVGPPHGTMLRVPLMRPATQVSTTGDIETLVDRQHGRGDDDERRRPVTVEDTAPVAARCRERLTGSFPATARMNSTNLSKRPTSIMMPVDDGEEQQRAVDDIEAITSMTMSRCPDLLRRAEVVGTRMSARIGESRLVMISVMERGSWQNRK